MKRNDILNCLLVTFLGLMLASPLQAIEKRKKDPASPKHDTTQVKPKQTLKSSLAPKPVDTLSNRLVVPQVFDDFIDVNNNGIDDRLEHGGYVVPKKPVVDKPTPAGKPTIASPQQVKKPEPTRVEPAKKPEPAKADPVKKPATVKQQPKKVAPATTTKKSK